MTEENTQVVEQVEDDAAFNAGFAEARGDEPPTETEQGSDEALTTEPQVEQVEQPAEVEEVKPTFLGLPEDKVKELLLKAEKFDELSGKFDSELRRMYGKFGELNQRIQQTGSKLSPDKMTRLREQYPELADLLVQDLSDAITVGSGPQVDPAQIEQLVSSRVQEQATAIQRENEKRWLTVQHPDWQDVARSQDFQLWKTTLAPQERNELDNTWDALYLANKMSQFKEWRDGAVRSKETKQKRLESAVTPRGDRAPTPTIQDEEEAFMAAFKAAR